MRLCPKFAKLVGVGTLLLALCLGTCVIGLAEEQPPFSIEIVPSQNAIQPGTPIWKAGAPVFLIIRMKNSSSHVLHFNLTNPALNYHANVLDPNGKQVPETDPMRKLRESDKSRSLSERNILIELKPGETCNDGIEVSFYHEMTKPGQYTIQIERDLPPELDKGIVKSNVIHADIVLPSSLGNMASRRPRTMTPQYAFSVDLKGHKGELHWR